MTAWDWAVVVGGGALATWGIVVLAGVIVAAWRIVRDWREDRRHPYGPPLSMRTRARFRLDSMK